MIKYISALGMTFLCVGCGAPEFGPPAAPSDAPASIVQARDMISDASFAIGDPLKSKADLKGYEGKYPEAAAAINSGAVKLIWGKTMKEMSPKPEVIAYESLAETGEGWSVKDDGKIYKVTSADLVGLPKTK